MSSGTLPWFKTDGTLRRDYIYLLVCKDDDGPRYVKIGHSANPGLRLSQLLVGCPITPRSFAICPVGYHHSNMVAKVESALHRAFKDRKARGEWFLIDTTSAEDRNLFHLTFNTACRDLKAERGVWSKISVKKHLEAQKARKAYWAKQSKATIRMAKDVAWSRNRQRAA